ncbi:MAG: hypothetical protein ACXVDZ_14330 [Bacteroidia bacterium]
MDYIDTQIKIFKKIEDLYDINRKNLAKQEKALKDDIEKILLKFSKEFHLESITETSVNPTKYYSVKSRVKTTHSLKEKLIRKNLGLKICQKHALSLANFEEKHSEIKKSIFLFDDIIGARIVTELKTDCFKVHKLIKEKNEYFKDLHIVFNTKEVANQPETMKNGLPIFRIKGIYKSKYGFELQIKSKIDEAWGDMDHSIFYKDYSVSPIKNTVQVTMNNVGGLLDKIEELLLGLRDSESNYKEKKDEVDFLKELSEDVFVEIKKKLGDNYELGNIASSLKFIKAKSKIKKKDQKITNLDYSFLSFKVKKNLCKNYLLHRNSRFELLIMEALYFTWKQKANDDFILSANNYEEELENYLKFLSENISENANSLFDDKGNVISITFVEHIFESFSAELSSTSVFLNSETAIKLYIINKYLHEAFTELGENMSDIPDDNSFKELLINLYSKCFLLFENIPEIVLIKENFSEFIEQNPLATIVYGLNDLIVGQLNNYKLADNKEELDRAGFMKDLLDIVLIRVRN